MTRRGAGWERVLEVACREYRRDQLAVVVRVHGERGHDGSYRSKAPVDFLGCLHPSGRAVAFDAKRSTKRWPLRKVEQHQAQLLEAVTLAGGVAGIALRLDGVDWWLPWAALADRYWSSTPGTLTADTVDQYGIRMPGPGRWLEVAQ